MKCVYLLLLFSFGSIVGRTQSPQLVADINPGKNGTNFISAKAFGNNLLFVADTTTNSTQPTIYITKPSGGVTLLQTFTTFSSVEYMPKAFTHYANKLFFLARDSSLGYGLWATDGTPTGTTMIKFIVPAKNTYSLSLYQATGDSMTVYNNKLYFAATDTTKGAALWVSDGTDTGTHQIINIDTSGHVNGGIESPLVLLNNSLYFIGLNDNNTIALWKSDGTVQGTQPLTLQSNASYTSIGSPILALHKLFFSVENYNINNNIPPIINLFCSDGSDTGTHNINRSTLMVDITNDFVELNNQLLFYAIAYTQTSFMQSTGIWCTDGRNFLRKLNNFSNSCSGSTDNKEAYLNVYNNTAYYGTDEDMGKSLLFSTDGSLGGSGLFMNLSPATARPNGGRPNQLTLFNNRFYFKMYDNTSHRVNLWACNGTESGTFMIQDTAANSIVSDPCMYDAMPFCVAIGNTLYYTINYDSTIGQELYKVDTTLPLQQAILQQSVNTHVYPNPFNQSLMLENIPTHSRYSIVSMVGRTLCSGLMEQDNENLDTRLWPEGIYLVTIYLPDGSRQVRKLVKQ